MAPAGRPTTKGAQVAPDAEIHAFRIYVAGETLRSQRAVANLRAICDAALGDNYDLEIVDVLAETDRATEERVIATPTVIRLAPPPRRRVIGDLSDHHMASQALGLDVARISSLPGGSS